MNRWEKTVCGRHQMHAGLEAPVKTNRYLSSLSNWEPGKSLCVSVYVCVNAGLPPPNLLSGGAVQTSLLSFFIFSPSPAFPPDFPSCFIALDSKRVHS